MNNRLRINRNRMLLNGKDAIFSLPLKSASDALDVRERELAADFNRDKLLQQFVGAYRRAPYFEQTLPLAERIIRHEDQNLFGFLYHSLVRTCEHLGITTEIQRSSDVSIDHQLKSQDKVLALCAAVGADSYLNAIGGRELYSRAVFQKRGVELAFIQSKAFEYSQFGETFVPWLSIIDVMMFNRLETVRNYISTDYELVYAD